MSEVKWKVNCQVFRKKGDEPGHYDTFQLEADPEEYVLDLVERVWAFHDRTLVYRHACHHSTCGACGMRVNGAEKLTCITHVKDVTHDGGTITFDPLRNFPVISDLANDLGILYTRMEKVGHRSVISVAEEPPGEGYVTPSAIEAKDILRLSDCIECGLCISACPVPLTSTEYMGPAILAGALQHGLKNSNGLLSMVDSEDGVWRCHSAYECSAVCPSYVEPGEKIMTLRRQIIVERFKRFFNPKKD